MRHPPPLLSFEEPGGALAPAAVPLVPLPPAFALLPGLALPPPAPLLAFMVPAPPFAPPVRELPPAMPPLLAFPLPPLPGIPTVPASLPASPPYTMTLGLLMDVQGIIYKIAYDLLALGVGMHLIRGTV